MKEIMSQCVSQVELWKITAKDRLLYFSSMTELGQLPLDLLNSDFGCIEKASKILDDIDKTILNLDSKVSNIKIKKLKIEFKSLDSLFTLTLQMSGTG